MNEDKDFIFLVRDEDYDDDRVFRVKPHAMQYILKKMKEWNIELTDDNSNPYTDVMLSELTEREINYIIGDMLTYKELFFID